MQYTRRSVEEKLAPTMIPSSPSILLVDDEASITEHLGAFLERAGYRVLRASDGAEALRVIDSAAPDLVILDVLLPEMDGRTVLRLLRAKGDRRPVILLTQVGESAERALALEEGADDYLNKPFDPRELLARARAVLRRAEGAQGALASAWKLTAGALVLDRRARRVSLAGRPLGLTPKALALLEYMMTHPDELLTRDRLLDAVWGWDFPAGQRAVDTRVAELRRLLAEESGKPVYIETVPGEGYRFSALVRSES